MNLRSKTCHILMALALSAPAAVILSSCGDDDAGGPPADVVIRINESNFNPASIEISAGQVVEWENRFSQTRTVTSGTGPDDPDAGLEFDESLAGYPSGKVVGGRYRMKFDTPDTIRYFSREVPPGFVGVFSGNILVTR